MKKITQNLSRRTFLKGSIQTSTTLASTASLSFGLTACQNTPSSSLTFQETHKTLDQHHHVPNDYHAKPLISWGDTVIGDSSPFQPEQLNSITQSQRFGFNNDFIAFMPLSDAADATSAHAHVHSNNSTRGLLCVNHEYTSPHMMFSGYATEEAGDTQTLSEHMATEMQACGHSVVEVYLDNNEWKLQQNSHYNRRISLTTPMKLSGPVAGHARLKTSAAPNGIDVLGTVGNCAGGKTPWGTVLIAEEGIGGAFMGDTNTLTEAEKDNFERLAIAGDYSRPWGTFDSRFDINQEPNEANRFGWMVEFNPYDPLSVPHKRTALGRFEHEGTTIVAKPNQPIVAYTGDDDEFQFFYKFVSNEVYQPNQSGHNQHLLDDGILYVAKLHNDGQGEWLPLLHGQQFLTEEHGFHSQADVLIECRRAAQLIGATPMDRPEDIETNPVNDCTYVMLTKNKKRKTTNAGNLRINNKAGHILELVHPGTDGHRDHTALTFEWLTFILGGDPKGESSHQQGFYGTGPEGQTVTENGWFATPDNLAFDKTGNMWVATDGCESFGFHDGLWAVPTAGPYRAMPKHFFGCPQGAELCGPEFTPDGTTLFVAVQHPADTNGSTFDNPMHRWPNFDPSLPPRPSVVAIRRKDGGLVGS